MQLFLESHFLAIGEKTKLWITSNEINEFSGVQVNIFTTCVLNPRSVLSFGARPVISKSGKYFVEIDSKNLSYGIYEIKFLRVYESVQDDIELSNYSDYSSGVDFDRIFIQILKGGDEHESTQEIKGKVLELEERIEQDFLAPIDIRIGTNEAGHECACFVFVRNLLLGSHIRFDNFEIIPTGAGLGVSDQIDFINKFFNNKTLVKLKFPYTSELSNTAQQASPSFAVQFPSIVATNYDQVKDYCAKLVEKIILALALSRGSSGEIFGIVVLDKITKKACHYPFLRRYRGNLITGDLAGEGFDQIKSYLFGLENEFLYFLCQLYHEAIHESSYSFQYVRYWQILEILAQSKNYDSNELLLNHEGCVILNDGRPRRVYGSVNTVYALIRDGNYGNTNDVWKEVNIWFSMRSAATHHGSVFSYTKLSRKSTRKWAELAFAEINASLGSDSYLQSLKWVAQYFLMKELVACGKMENKDDVTAKVATTIQERQRRSE